LEQQILLSKSSLASPDDNCSARQNPILFVSGPTVGGSSFLAPIGLVVLLPGGRFVTKRKHIRQRSRHLQYETLEAREVMAAGVTASLNSAGVLSVVGTNSADNITFRQTSGKISIVGVSGSWSASKVKSVVANLHDGSDHVSLDSFANGGNQLFSPYVTIYSGNGNDSVHVASGHDVSFSGAGHMLLVRPNGTADLDGAAVNWNPPAPTTASLGGTVWEDHNGNGVRDSGDQGLAGWHILINGADRATTDVNGNWSVANLTPGSYAVQEVSQSGWTDTSGNAGYTVAAAAGVSTANLSFGNFKNISASGFAWEDHNGNSLWETGDIGLAGWHILINCVDRATTDVYGHWSVADLGPGTFTVQELSQSGWTGTAGAAGFNFATSSGVDTGLNFGDFKNISVSGFAWEDHNGNSLWETGDIGLAGWHILINGVDRATTDVYGHWSVANLGPGTYSVQEAAQSGWSGTAGAAGFNFATSSGVDTGLNFGDFRNISLNGYACEDHNGDGAWESGDNGLSGWHILINGVDRATTDVNGYWSVSNLGPGVYAVQEVSQSGWTKTASAAGYSLGASSGVDNGNLSFGDFKNVTLSGTKWNDVNGNGVRDAGDNGLAGWHILINGVDRASTDSSGNWSVSNLGPGTYAIQEIAQSGWSETSGNAGYSVNASSGIDNGNLSFGDFWNIPAPPSTNWFDTHVTDAALRSLGHNLYTDNLIDRSDMISLLRETESGNQIDATELADLRAIVANTALFGNLDYVDQLAADVVNGSVANAKYLGGTLGNLVANSSSTQMDNLVNKWFLGLDHPIASGDSYNTYSSYRQFSGSLFVNGATYTDIKQGYVGDCYLVSSLAEAALRDNSAITSMFIVNGDGTYTLKFYNSGAPTYLTVDSYLPTDSSGRLIYAGLGMVYNNAGNELWTALAEKGYVQLNELGWERSGLSGSGQNAYSAINGGYIYAAQRIITGQATVAFAYTGTAPNQNFSTFVTAFNAGKLIGFATPATPASSTIVGNHAYAVVGYDSVNQTVTMFNPWGIQYGLVTMTWSQIQQNFIYFDRTA
jgi:hypothetical protein